MSVGLGILEPNRVFLRPELVVPFIISHWVILHTKSFISSHLQSMLVGSSV